jgi:putative ABC transport system permease protein
VDLQLNVLTGTVVALLGIAVVIALIGIGNTLGLSVLERVREHSLLRALGLTRRQLRATLAVEAVLLSVVATVLGTVIGVTFAWVGVQTMVRAAVDAAPMVLPWGQLAVVILVAGVAGLLSALLPARRAARITPAAGLSLE